MKFYSEITKKLYDSKDELVKAEVAATKAKSDREVKAKEVKNMVASKQLSKVKIPELMILSGICLIS